MSGELLTTEELAMRIKYDARTIRERLKDAVLLEGIHYIRPFGRRKILFVWDSSHAGSQDSRSCRPSIGINRSVYEVSAGGGRFWAQTLVYDARAVLFALEVRQLLNTDNWANRTNAYHGFIAIICARLCMS